MFSPAVLTHWVPATADVHGDPHDDRLRVVVDDTLPDNRSVMLLELVTGGGCLSLTPQRATQSGLVAGALVDPDDVRRALGAAGVALHDPDHLLYLPLEEQAVLLDESPPSGTRQLDAGDEGDGAAFAGFTAAAPPADLDEAFVELDHWLVVGTFVDDRLVSVASAYPWAGTTLADVGVLTLPDHQGRGLARRTVRALSGRALAAGHEPQYRCQLDNAPSVALARAAGFAPLATWQVVDVDD
ncbi:GNAT family N-acetyltransferase [Nocardioides plantarum]|uniref:GNAT family N-acetyltransferase n=1 Tax=Nocardioides plantarum TaxID=29299 RepID=A0ABV5K957_9ACTN|nr:GNAT family N-acetyltransferase [Nocardioides plantarum]